MVGSLDMSCDVLKLEIIQQKIVFSTENIFGNSNISVIYVFGLDNLYFRFKGTVHVILSDPPCKDVNARLTTVS